MRRQLGFALGAIGIAACADARDDGFDAGTRAQTGVVAPSIATRSPAIAANAVDRVVPASRPLGGPGALADWHLAMPDAPTPRAGCLAFDSTRGRVVLFQGGNPWLRDRATWEWDGAVWTRRASASAPPPRASCAMTFDAARGRVVMFGGSAQSATSYSDLGDTWEWDGATWTERTPSASPTPRSGHAMAYDVARGVTVLYGGGSSDTWEWDGATWTARTPPTSPPAIYDGALAYEVARAKTVLFTGAETWEWDGASWSKRAPATSPPARSAASMAYDVARGVAVLYGGGDSSSVMANVFADTWEWDGTDWSERSLSASPGARRWFAMTYDATRGAMVLFGGKGKYDQRFGWFSDTWTFDGAAWSQRLPDSSPLAWGGLAFDEARGELVRFGPAAPYGAQDPETWTRKGTTWTRRTPTHAPSARAVRALAYDSAREKTVLFGGWIAGGFVNDTWEWDGADWTLRTPTTSPSNGDVEAYAYDRARRETVVVLTNLETWTWDGTRWSSHGVTSELATTGSMAFDEARGVIVWLGGSGTFEWDGTRWTQRGSAPPPPATGGPMAYDRAARRVVLFAESSRYVDTSLWQWDGALWTQRATSTAPAPRVGSQLAFDADRNELVLVGGSSVETSFVGEPFEDTWVCWGSGAYCTSDAQCHGATCVDGVCCDSPCGGGDPNDCLVCAAALGATANGVCTTLADGASCSDGDACTRPDRCTAGSCTSGAPVTCAPIDDCHEAGRCDPSTGACSIATKPDGTPCADDGSVCTVDACVAGACTHAPGHAGLVCRPSVGACDVAERCTGTTASCPADALVPAGTSCAPATCSDEGVVRPTCDAAGACVTHLPASCGAYACASGACRTSCRSDLDCASGYACEWSGECLALVDAGAEADVADAALDADAGIDADAAPATDAGLDTSLDALDALDDTGPAPDAPDAHDGGLGGDADALVVDTGVEPDAPIVTTPDGCGCRAAGGRGRIEGLLGFVSVIGVAIARRRKTRSTSR